MSVGLNGLLEGPHLLDFNELPTPLLVNYIALITLKLKLFGQPPLNLSQVLHFFLKLLDLLVGLLRLLALESIDSFEQAVRVFDFMLDQGPQLLE